MQTVLVKFGNLQKNDGLNGYEDPTFPFIQDKI